MFKLVSVIFLLFLLMPNYGVASDWFCKGASAKLEGKSLLACGVGKDKSIQQAKDKARESAISEYERLCSLSYDCRSRQITVEPMRTECIETNSQHTCYRAIYFHLNDKRKNQVIVNTAEVQQEIEKRNNELNILRSHLSKLRELERKKKDIEQTEIEIKKTEGEQIQLKEMVSDESIKAREYKYTHLLYRHSFRANISYVGYEISRSNETNTALGLTYEWRPIQTWGLSVGVNWGSDLNGDLVRSDGDVPTSGTANSSIERDGELSFQETNLGITYYPNFYGMYLRGTLGHLKASREVYSVSYGPLGTKTSTQKSSVDSTDTSLSLSVGIDGRNDFKGLGWYLEVGAGSLSKSTKVKPIATFGLNFGF